ncbi:acyl-CoA hydrolase [Micrococcus sp.]|uniref:acyl-CoA hydrolase n=1 Tax=Micrococcus sp. TaxID=1271 RepID=UPI002A91AAF5|nr:acyl-CoA hydrolase [Micrococcus sp.]MDY6054676.1 acyl-CoA hydrolase [Micrococcus sp.]
MPRPADQPVQPVRLGPGRPEPTAAERALVAAAATPGDLTAVAALLDDAGTGLDLPLTGGGRTREQWELLATVAAVDLSAARTVEPHLDALSILDQAGVPAPAGLLGVYASESGGRTPALRPGEGSELVLDGEKPWCSLADLCAHAVVTGRQDDGTRQAVLVDLRHPGVTVSDAAWPALGLAPVTTVGLRFEAVPGVAVGGPEWYLRRPGFAWGGIGVAAVWFGGAVHVARTLRTSLERRADAASQGRGPGPDQAAQAALGRVDRLLHMMAGLLARAAEDVDAGRLDHDLGLVEADRVRGTVERACTEVLDVVGRATGPGPLAQDAAHARAVADLQVYLRQHHGDRDDARLGAALLEADPAVRAGLQPW